MFSLRFYRRFGLFILLLSYSSDINGWGFFAHREINEKAVYTLPPGMIGFYKRYIAIIRERAVNADKRRSIVPGEAPCHYIDMEYYGDVPSCYWGDAVVAYSSEMLDSHGILPWNVYRVMCRLTHAFEKGEDVELILRLSADLGHYVADAHVPLHTTENYDGQLTDQRGIHGLWESRLPELFSDGYDFFVGKPVYITEPQITIWRVVWSSHALAKRVLALEKRLQQEYKCARKSFEKRGTRVSKVYARAYARAYHNLLCNMVEERMRASIHMVASVWYTCWVNGGSPNLDVLCKKGVSKKKLQKIQLHKGKKKLQVRVCPE